MKELVKILPLEREKGNSIAYCIYPNGDVARVQIGKPTKPEVIMNAGIILDKSCLYSINSEGNLVREPMPSKYSDRLSVT